MGAGGVINLRKFRHFLLNFPLGIFLGTSFTLLLVWILDSQLSLPFERVVASLFGALAGLIAATLALAGVLTNIANQNHLVDKQRLARLGSARAVLPLTLSRINSVCLLGFHVAEQIEALKIDPVQARLRFDALEISGDDLKTLKECIEVADSNSAAWLSLIVAHFQIQVSSLESPLFDPNFLILDEQVANRAAQWALIQCFIMHLFTFSRTSIPADDTLPRERFSLPFDINPFSASAFEVGKAIVQTRSYFNENGGWSAGAFLIRLKPPS